MQLAHVPCLTGMPAACLQVVCNSNAQKASILTFALTSLQVQGLLMYGPTLEWYMPRHVVHNTPVRCEAAARILFGMAWQGCRLQLSTCSVLSTVRVDHAGK